MRLKLELWLLGKISITSNSRWQQANGRRWTETKEPLDEVERGEWKVGFKTNIQKPKIMAPGPITYLTAKRCRKMETIIDCIILGSKIPVDNDCSYKIKRWLLLGRKAMTHLDSIFKSRHYFGNKCPSSQSYGFSNTYGWMWELDHKEGWALKNWYFWTVVLEKTLESLLDCKEI